MSSGFDLTGKKAIVTGGGTGIGRGIALALSAAGSAVAVSGRRVELLEETARLVSDAGGRCVVQGMDVTDKASVSSGMSALVEQLGGLDILVNNAGVGGPNGCVLDGPDRWDEIVRANLDGMFFCTREAAKRLPDGGRIINISSVLGRFGVPGYTAYCASKHGVIGFTKALALEVAPRKITANAICPGWVETGMARDGMELMAQAMQTSYEDARKLALSQVPLGRIIEPEEVGQLAVYLSSDAAGACTGQAISLCGGSTMV